MAPESNDKPTEVLVIKDSRKEVELEAQLADLPFLKQELDRLQNCLGPQSCDIHASFSAGCLNCRLAQREAQLAEAKRERDKTIEQCNGHFDKWQDEAKAIRRQLAEANAQLAAHLATIAVLKSGKACPTCLGVLNETGACVECSEMYEEAERLKLQLALLRTALEKQALARGEVEK